MTANRDDEPDAAVEGAPAWEPLLTGELADRARAAVADIAAALQQGEPAGPELANGAAGEAVFFAYAAELLEDDDLGDVVDVRLAQATRGLAEQPLGFELLGGVPGIAWAFDHLVEVDPKNDPNAAIDQALLTALRKSEWRGPYGLIDGLVGLGVYAAHRPSGTAGAEILALVMRHLERLSETAAGGLAWRSPPEELGPDGRTRAPSGFFNLGLSHGIPGIVGLASLASELGIEADVAGALATGGVRWLEGQRLEGADAQFPATLVDEPPQPGRSAWCYGDPGVAVALARAARSFDNPGWSQRAAALARGVAARAVERCRVHDAGLCHGAAGLAHVLHRLSRATGVTGVDSLRASAAAWFARALDQRTPGTGVAGFEMYMPPTVLGDGGRFPVRGYLTGAAGIGLALIDALAREPLAWNQPLLTDVA